MVPRDKASRRHGERNAPRRQAQGLGPNKYLAQNISWVHKSLLGKSKHNITMEVIPKASNGNKANASKLLHENASNSVRESAEMKVHQRQEEIRRVRNQLQEKKERRKEEIVKLSSMTSRHVDGTCQPHGNVAYIKTHKTASTTLQTIINRFGLLNRLSFVLNKVSPTNGHLVYIPVTKHSPQYFFLPPLGVGSNDISHFNYNMIAVHLRYNRSAMDFFMLPGTKYISIIREPSAHFESAFNHFRFTDSFSPATRCRVKGHEIEEFMRRPGYYRRRLKTLQWDTTRGLRWYYARNNQIFDLGLDSKYHKDETIVNQTVDALLKELDLVLISEYFDESLVVLKKMLCWTFDDIIYISKNQRTSRVDIDSTTRQKIREWSRADTILYERFNATLWLKIKDYGPNFELDLAAFRKRKDGVFQECAGEEYIRSHGVFKHKEIRPSANSSLFCTLVAESKTRLFHRVWMRQAGIWNAKLKASYRAGSRNRTKTKQVMAMKLAQQKRTDGRLGQRNNGHTNVKVPLKETTGEKDIKEEDNEETSIVPQGDDKIRIECANIAPEVNINFESSDGDGMIFPEEI